MFFPESASIQESIFTGEVLSKSASIQKSIILGEIFFSGVGRSFFDIP